jgi:hypothetical protein
MCTASRHEKFCRLNSVVINEGNHYVIARGKKLQYISAHRDRWICDLYAYHSINQTSLIPQLMADKENNL